MADSQAFTALCDALEGGSSLDRLEARGTVRLALKQAGLEPKTVTSAELGVVIEKILPGELETRGVEASICGQLAAAVAAIADSEAVGDSPEAVFSRLGS